jgi:hypothetical protein
MNAISSSMERPPLASMFAITTREDPAGRVAVVGKPSRARAKVMLNIPLCQATRDRLDAQLLGSLSMGTSALIEWALEELQRQGITLEARLER